MSNFKEVDNNMKLYPLTRPQKRIWYIEKIYPNTSLYNIGGTVEIKGHVNFIHLEEAINFFVKKNEGVRLQFYEKDHDVKQYLKEFKRGKIDYIDFSKYQNPKDEFDRWIQKESQKPFDLQKSPLFYFALFKIDDNYNGYFVKLHHIIADGWSINIMTDQIYDIYMKLINNESINEKVEYSYLDYILQEQNYLESERFLKNKKFWNEKFNILPEGFAKRASDNTQGRRKEFQLNKDKSQRIIDFVTENECSLNTFFVSLYLIYLSKITNDNDIIIGTPVLNRSGKEQKSMVGMFTSTMPFRMNLEYNDSVLEFMQKLNKELRIGMDIFQKYFLPGKTIVFLGSSGVGKSTITNYLLGEERQRTKEISDASGKGRHTTTRSELIFHDSGCMIIDTPGLKELQLWGEEEALNQSFEDIVSLKAKCKYSDCQHETEKGCAVKKEIEDGIITIERFNSYKKQLEELHRLNSRKIQYDKSMTKKMKLRVKIKINK